MTSSMVRGLFLSTKAFFAFFFLLTIICTQSMALGEVASPSIDPRLRGFIEDFDGDAFEPPSAIFIDKEHGEIYLADSTSGDIFVFGLDGSPIFRLGFKQGIGNPTDILVRDDNIYRAQESRP